MPSPPFPSPVSAVLAVIVRNAIEAVRAGETSIEDVILHAAVHGWYEGDIEGEDACPGCDSRGDVRKQKVRGWIDPKLNRGVGLLPPVGRFPCPDNP